MEVKVIDSKGKATSKKVTLSETIFGIEPNDHAIYLPQPYDNNTVNEVDLGVPSGAEVRTWRGN